MEKIKEFLKIEIGSGYGYGDGSGDDIKSFNHMTVYYIDGIATLLKNVKKTVAKGFILNRDLTLTPCFVVKGNNCFAHGETLKGAMEALENKIFENMDTDETIEQFLQAFTDVNKKYPAQDFFVWHNRLTGSCEMGRKSFVKDKEIDLENGMYTVKEFVEITKNAYGGEIIRELEERIQEGKNDRKIKKIY